MQSHQSRPHSEQFRHICMMTILALVVMAFLSGVLLMLYYAPSVQSAWASVWYVQTQVPSGWLIRGIHYYSSNALIVALIAYLLLLLFQKAYVGTRAKPWRFGWCLLLVTVALSLSGFLLPWDQWAYWGTQVRMNILALTPLLGGAMRDLLQGGESLGQASLTRFYTLHVIILPCLAMTLMVGMFSVHGAKRQRHVVDAKNLLIVSTVVAGLLAWSWYAHGTLAWTLLDAPADAASSDYPARPEWYALFLYQWLKYFESPSGQVVGAIIVPTLAMAGIMLAPRVTTYFSPRLGHTMVVSVLMIGFSMAAMLTWCALQEDQEPSEVKIAAVRRDMLEHKLLSDHQKKILRASTFHEQRRWADWVARRSFELAAQHGVPVDGPLVMLAGDPQIQGPKLFSAHCASCHRYDGHDGCGRWSDQPATSSDLVDFGSFERIRGFLREPMHPLYFGHMKKEDGQPAHTKMQRWLEAQQEDCENESERIAFESELNDVARFLAAQAKIHDREGAVQEQISSGTVHTSSHVDDAVVERGRKSFMSNCNECHAYQGQRSGTTKAPELYAYASWRWMYDMISDPSQDSLYRSKGREPAQMPSFKDRLSQSDRKALAMWLSASKGN